MKTNQSTVRALIPSFAAALAVATLLHASPPAGAPPPEELAMRKVNLEILTKVSPPERRFSRAAPVPRHTLEFQPQLLVGGETRLPFTIKPRSIGTEAPPSALLEGYVRLSDQEIFLYLAETKTHVPASEHPRFAPKPPIRIDPPRPT
ncbi:MAG: hypothetical protein V4819_18220 [Verrucomicrobiota bacterium]